ncbi:hypothetical protein WJX81_003179 [Elliptochloris bilobata]|uniref:Uncharacterized protein n=1 Tax=Elliptochloris bilobata TaxID=381761 RepID=A0AAW1QKH3_9CHLO
MALTLRDVGLFALCILFPPLAVFFIKGRCDTDLVLDILLCIFAWLPGQIYAVYLLVTVPSQDDAVTNPLLT